jgi:hypothetical protein
VQFHRKDIISQHMIGSREQERSDKIQKAERERSQRIKNPEGGVEFIDLDGSSSSMNENCAWVETDPDILDASSALAASSKTKPVMSSSRWSHIL